MSTATELTIEQRLTALETAFAELRQQLEPASQSDGLKQIRGIMKDNPAFEEFVALGRAIRQADHSPKTEKTNLADPAGQDLGPGQDESTAIEPTSRPPIKRAKLDDQGRLIPLTPAEGQAQAEAIRAMLDRLQTIENGPDEDDAEFMRAIDSHRPHRPLFEGLY